MNGPDSMFFFQMLEIIANDIGGVRNYLWCNSWRAASFSCFYLICVCGWHPLFHMGIILRFHMGVADIILRFHPETKSLRLLQNFYAGWISNKFSSFRYYISLVCLFELKKFGLFLLKMPPLPCVIFTSRETCRSVLRV